MLFLQSLLLGFIQGITEFLPVSSTAHLILVPWLLSWQLDADVVFVFDILLQLGTLAAVVAYFWRDLLRMAQAMVQGLLQRQPFATADARLGWLIGVATVPAGVLGLTLKDFFEGLHQNPLMVALIVLFGASLLFVAERLGRRTRNLETLTWVDALIIGSSQALALLPGVSRSAATMCGGLVRGLERPAAARFSFLMSIPVMLAAGLVAIKDLVEIPNFTQYLPPLSVGFLAAAVVGFFAIKWLLGYLAQRSLDVFAWYRIGFGLLCLVVYFVRG